jgi:hypothetical protein
LKSGSVEEEWCNCRRVAASRHQRLHSGSDLILFSSGRTSRTLRIVVFKVAPTPLLLAFLLVFLNSEGGWAGDRSRNLFVSRSVRAPFCKISPTWISFSMIIGLYPIFFHKVVAFLYIHQPIEPPTWPFKP